MEGTGLGLVADIGRQSVRFGITGGNEGTAPRDVRSFHTAEHPTFTSALVSYLNGVGLEGQRLRSVLAVAGAVRGDLINLTGGRWYISLSGVEAVLRERPLALNECAANALALTQLPDRAFQPLPGPAMKRVNPGGNFLLVGPGTGLGVAALVSHDGRLVPIQSEAAHMSFAPTTPDERRVVEFLARRGHAPSNEMLLSANGLCAIYEALNGRAPGRPEDVTQKAGSDPAARAALELFIGALGNVIGDLVLAFDAWDGAFITGSIARAIGSALAGPTLRRRIETKTAFRRQLCELPVAVVHRNDLELVGAAAALGGQ